MDFINELKPNPSNPRTIKAHEFARLKKSVESFTKMLEIRPIAYDEDKIIWGGNMRFQALKELSKDGLEIKNEYFKELTGFNLEEKRQFAIRDNIDMGEWNDDILANEWSDLDLKDWGIDTAGWDKGVEEDEAPEISEDIISKNGEIYSLGRHRLMCGDSTKIEEVNRLMNGNKADLVFTDPPFNLVYGGTGKKNRFDKQFIAGDNISEEDFIKFLDQVNQNIKLSMSEVASIYEWMDFRQISKLYDVMKKYFHIDQMIVWDKTFIKLGGNYRNQHEFMLYGYDKDINDTTEPYVSITDQCIYAKNNKKLAKWFGGRSQSNIWYKITDPTSTYKHPTQKPLELPARAIKNSSEENDIVLDMFGGSGSTMMACEQLNRVSYSMELDPQYCDVIRKRYAKHIGALDRWTEVTKVI